MSQLATFSSSAPSESLWYKLFGWLDADYFPQGHEAAKLIPKRTVFSRWAPFIFLHSGCLGILVVGISPVAVWTAVAMYFVRMFAITAFYHRYFSHKSFSTSRFMQFIFAFWGNMSVQKGALWWASHHRHHHKASDTPDDTHSPVQNGFLWSHIGWITATANMPTEYKRIPDLKKFPELLFLNRYDWLAPLFLIVALAVLGGLAPESWHTSSLQMVVWGFFVSTVFLFHGTASINSLSHVWGNRRFETTDTSRNNFWLALITMGEGWHNNHHFYQGSTRQGIYWWEVDVTFYILTVMSWFGLVWDLHPIPKWVYAKANAA